MSVIWRNKWRDVGTCRGVLIVFLLTLRTRRGGGEGDAGASGAQGLFTFTSLQLPREL